MRKSENDPAKLLQTFLGFLGTTEKAIYKVKHLDFPRIPRKTCKEDNNQYSSILKIFR